MSVERLTEKRMKGEGFILADPKEYKAFARGEKPTGKQIYQRLLEIEDILGDDYDLDRLRELVEADRDGRCVVLPCKPGDTVYQADAERIYELGIRKIIYDCGHIAFDMAAVGKSVFLTREEAEAALRREQE